MQGSIVSKLPLFFLSCGLAAAAPPANDDRANAEVLSASAHVSFSGTLEEATQEPGEPDLSEFGELGFDFEPTVWHRWTAPAGIEWLRVEVNGIDIPSVLAVYPLGSDINLDLARSPDPNVLIVPIVAGSTYEIRISTWVEDVWDSLFLLGLPPDFSYDLTLDAIGTPSTAGDFIVRGRGQLALGTGAAATGAVSDFTAALALDSGNPEALFLRGLARLLALEDEPAFAQLAADLGYVISGPIREGGVSIPTDLDGDPIFAPGASTGDIVTWIEDELMPRLAAIRADFAAITDISFTTRLSAAETGLEPVSVDRGDVLALTAATHGIEVLFNLIFTYDLGVSLESMVTLEKSGQLNVEQTMATFTNLLQFATTDHRTQFASDLTAMRDSYQAASPLILARADQSDWITRDIGNHPDQDTALKHHLDTAVSSLSGPVDWDGTTVDLSRLLGTTRSLREWLPTFSGHGAVPGTLPDPTFDGVLPGFTRTQADAMLYELGVLVGMADYAALYGSFLEFFGYPSGPFDDADGDRLTNFDESVFMTDILTPDLVFQSLEPQLVGPGQTELTFTFIRAIDAFAGNWPLVVSVSDDLGSWDRTEAKVSLLSSTPNGDGISETVTYQLTGVDPGQTNHRYFRIEAVFRP